MESNFRLVKKALKSLAANTALTLRETNALPQLDPSGTYPAAFVDFVRPIVRRRRVIGNGGKKPPMMQAPTNSPIDPVAFVLSLVGTISWQGSPVRVRLAKQIENTITRCERRIHKRGFETFAEAEHLNVLKAQHSQAICSRWIAYVLWGFALRQDPQRPSLRYLKDLAGIYDWHVRGVARKPWDRSLPSVFRAWRSNVYTLRAKNKQAINGISLQHFDALHLALAAKRGLTRRL